MHGLHVMYHVVHDIMGYSNVTDCCVSCNWLSSRPMRAVLVLYQWLCFVASCFKLVNSVPVQKCVCSVIFHIIILAFHTQLMSRFRTTIDVLSKR